MQSTRLKWTSWDMQQLKLCLLFWFNQPFWPELASPWDHHASKQQQLEKLRRGLSFSCLPYTFQVLEGDGWHFWLSWITLNDTSDCLWITSDWLQSLWGIPYDLNLEARFPLQMVFELHSWLFCTVHTAKSSRIASQICIFLPTVQVTTVTSTTWIFRNLIIGFGWS